MPYPNLACNQDARDEHPWLFTLSLACYHLSLNTKMITPREVVETGGRLPEFGKATHKQFPLAQIEGFGRQIIGWR